MQFTVDQLEHYAGLMAISTQMKSAAKHIMQAGIELTMLPGDNDSGTTQRELDELTELVERVGSQAYLKAREMRVEYPDCESPEPKPDDTGAPEVDTSVMLTADTQLYGETKRAYSKQSGKITGPRTPEEIAAWNFIYRNRSVAAGKGDPYFPGVYPVVSPHPAEVPSGD